MPESEATGAPAAPSELPANLVKFKTESGALDPVRVSQSIHSLEQSFHAKAEEAAQLQEALDAMTTSDPAPAAQPAPATISNEAVLQDFARRPREFVNDAVREGIARASAPLVEQVAQNILVTTHPELKDPEFKGKVAEFVRTLPAHVRNLEKTVEGATFLVGLYKERSAIGTPASPSAPASGGPSPRSSPSAGRTFTKQEIHTLLSTNPREYARLEGEIADAYRNGRVTK